MRMQFKDITKNGAFVAAMLALVVLLVPFAVEQIGEVTMLYSFPARKTVAGWFSPSPAGNASSPSVKAVDWEKYRLVLEEFARWADGRPDILISQPPRVVAEIAFVEEEKLVRKIWAVPVSSCTPADPATGKKGYVFLSCLERPLEEGFVIAPSDELCGYELLFVGERAAWFRVVDNAEEDSPMGFVRFPAFTRIDGESLLRGSRRYVPRDAFLFSTGVWLMLDSFLPPDGVLFKMLDEKRHVVATILCIVIGEKGGR